ncbi:hypothetical protein AXF42_Ash000667 [Apostasia shenzhenica]|uniref:Uncharacterized protein n=1 Tax=Apostasia shenzhenica TaxID=1088818 RepID=A0A2I0AH08_9ASPA|nr:hypothetical protein AXF42_Ash000667 [Apostasia shenzhenica]
MASNSGDRLLLLLLLFTATVAIAAAQPPDQRTATRLELQGLTEFVQSMMQRFNEMQPERVSAEGLLRRVVGVRLGLTVAEQAVQAVMRYSFRIFGVMYVYLIWPHDQPPTLVLAEDVVATLRILVPNGDFNLAGVEEFDGFHPLHE